jgi:hypothetical protein
MQFCPGAVKNSQSAVTRDETVLLQANAQEFSNWLTESTVE